MREEREKERGWGRGRGWSRGRERERDIAGAEGRKDRPTSGRGEEARRERKATYLTLLQNGTVTNSD